MDLPPMPGCLMFHIITAGSCWVESPLIGRHRLHAGDFALVPHGRGHLMRSGPKAASSTVAASASAGGSAGAEVIVVGMTSASTSASAAS